MKIRKMPLRTCVACRISSDKRNLIRIVRSPSGDVVLDPTGKMAGRGAYICQSADCMRKAIKERKLLQALKIDLSEEAVRQLENTFIQGSEDM